MTNEYSTEIQVLNLLQTIEKYYSHLRKLKQLKSEALKAKSQTKFKKTPNEKKIQENVSVKETDSDKKPAEGTEQQNVDNEDDTASGRKVSAKSKKSNISRINKTTMSNLPEINEDDDTATTIRDSMSREYFFNFNS